MTMKKEDIVDIIRSVSGNVYSVYTDWIRMCAITISNSVIWSEEMEKDYLNTAKRYSRKELMMFSEAFAILQVLMEEKYDDYLGSIYMMLETGSKRTGQFFTPYHVSKLLSEITGTREEETGRKLINEPTCGAGANIIAFLEKEKKRGVNYQEEYEIVAQDLDWNCVYMCYIQLSLYGAYGKVIQGDTLSDERKSNVLYTPMYMLQRGGVEIAR